MKLLFEMITLVLFFVIYQMYDIKAAIAFVIVAYTLITGLTYLKYRKLTKPQIAGFILVVVLGGATLVLDNELYFKWKPTVLLWLFATVLLVGQVFMKKNLLQKLGGQNLTLPDHIWARLNKIWIGFFIFLGALNLVIAYQFTTDTWVYFKLFGATSLLLVFILLQAICLWRYIAPLKENK